MKLRDARERLDGRIVAHHEIEHARKEARVGGRGAQRLRTDSTFGQEQAQPLRVAGDEGKCLNSNYFSYFPGVLKALFQLRYLPFRNLWSLFWNIMPESAQCVQASGNHFFKMPRRLNASEQLWR
jgi:hypothetical protein